VQAALSWQEQRTHRLALLGNVRGAADGGRDQEASDLALVDEHVRGHWPKP